MSHNLTRLLPWLIASVVLSVFALIVLDQFRGNVLAVTLYKAHRLSLGGWGGYWLDRALFPYDGPHEYLLPGRERQGLSPPHRANQEARTRRWSMYQLRSDARQAMTNELVTGEKQ